MENNKLFDRGLFVEGLKQTRTTGIINAVLVFLSICFMIFTYVVMQITLVVDEFSRIHWDDIVPMNIDINMIAFFAVAQIYLFAPLLALNIFKFLNKRNSSDFYHSIPHSKPCVFLSYFASITFWNIVIVVGCCLIGSAVLSCLPVFFVFNPATLFPFVFNIVAASILVSATVAIAVSITGNLLSNIIMSGMLIFAPRIVFTGLATIVNESVFVTSNVLPGFMNPLYNIPAGGLTYLLFNTFCFDTDYVDIFSNWRYGAYTLVLAIIYIVIAAILFRRRNSEAAGHSSSSKFVQAVSRISVGCIVSTIPIATIFSYFIDIDYIRSSSYERLSFISGIVIFYLVVVIAYLLYEVITTKTFKRLLKALPGLLIVAVFNVVVLGTMWLSVNIITSFKPSADEITGVSVEHITDIFVDYNYSLNDDTARNLNEKISNIYLDDQKIKEIISEDLIKTINYRTNLQSFVEFATKDETTTSLSVRIKTKNGVKKRVIYVPNSDYQYIVKTLLGRNDFQDILVFELPKLENIDNNINNYYLNLSCSEKLSDADIFKLYNSLSEEIKTLDNESLIKLFYTLTLDYSDENNNNYYDIININYYDNHGWDHDLHVAITDLTPKTAKLYIEMSNKANIGFDKTVLELLKSGDTEYITAYRVDDTEINLSSSDNCKKLYKYLTTHDYNEADNKEIVEISYDHPIVDEGYDDEYVSPRIYYFYVDPDIFSNFSKD